MTGNALLQFILFACVTMALAVPCAAYIARVFAHDKLPFDIVLGPLERFIDKVSGLARQALAKLVGLCVFGAVF